MKTSDQHAEKWRGVPPSNGLKAGEKLKKNGAHLLRRILLILVRYSVTLHKKKMSMEKYLIEVAENATEEIEALIEAGLNQYNDEITGTNDRRPLAVVVRDPASGEVLGGISPFC